MVLATATQLSHHVVCVAREPNQIEKTSRDCILSRSLCPIVMETCRAVFTCLWLCDALALQICVVLPKDQDVKYKTQEATGLDKVLRSGCSLRVHHDVACPRHLFEQTTVIALSHTTVQSHP
eukprot:409715-Amphidinium_carterae.2